MQYTCHYNVFFCSCLFATPDDFENVTSPDGKYEVSYIANGKTVIKNMALVDGIIWSPDSKWLVIYQYLRHMELLSLIDVKSGKKIEVDYWGYISTHAKEYGLMLPQGAPFSEIVLGRLGERRESGGVEVFLC